MKNLVLIVAVLFFTNALTAQKYSKPEWYETFASINKEVQQNSKAYTTLKYATETIGHRLTGSENGNKAEAYAYNLLKSYGFKNVKFQPFEVESWSRGSLTVKLGNSLTNLQPVKSVSLAHSPVAAEVALEVVDMGNGLDEDYAKDPAKVAGKIALVYLGVLPGSKPGTPSLHRSEKTAIATKYGAKGIITDVATKKGLPANLELTDNATGTIINKVQTDELGNYFITLPEGKDYTFTVNRKGYLFYSSAYALSGAAPDSTYVKNIALEPIKLASSFVFTQVLFDNNSFALLPASLPELNKLVQILEENPSMHIQISGYTDNIGKQSDNLVLSTNRAKAIVNYLSSKGIATERLSYKGFGSDNPIATNETAAGRALNRRTSFTITKL